MNVILTSLLLLHTNTATVTYEYGIPSLSGDKKLEWGTVPLLTFYDRRATASPATNCGRLTI